ncbi:hypothetical protein TYRP_021720 [Tyrophagus putrescentiae]|nr:hypothetical protein TYRP_021720 [Tyrophagus putrescentiae]
MYPVDDLANDAHPGATLQLPAPAVLSIHKVGGKVVLGTENGQQLNFNGELGQQSASGVLHIIINQKFQTKHQHTMKNAERPEKEK